jgi:hypothetical protein
MRTYNDDLVLASAAGCWIKDVALGINQRDTEYRRAFLDFGGMMKSNITLNTTIPGQTAYDPQKDNENIRKVKQQYEHAWLYKG